MKSQHMMLSFFYFNSVAHLAAQVPKEAEFSGRLTKAAYMYFIHRCSQGASSYERDLKML